MRFRYILLGITAVALVAVVAYLSFAHVTVHIFARKNALDISYNNLTRSGVDLAFKNLKVMSRPYGIGISARNADIKPKGNTYSFDFRDVRFLKKEKDSVSSYDNLAGLVSVPFEANWVYREIQGEIALSCNAIEITKLDAVSEDIKLKLDGVFRYDNTLDMNIIIYFAQELINRIPNEFSIIAMTDEGGGWKSLSVRLSGNYAEPSIQVSSKLFRLNIKSITEK